MQWHPVCSSTPHLSLSPPRLVTWSVLHQPRVWAPHQDDFHGHVQAGGDREAEAHWQRQRAQDLACQVDALRVPRARPHPPQADPRVHAGQVRRQELARPGHEGRHRERQAAPRQGCPCPCSRHHLDFCCSLSCFFFSLFLSFSFHSRSSFVLFLAHAAPEGREA